MCFSQKFFYFFVFFITFFNDTKQSKDLELLIVDGYRPKTYELAKSLVSIQFIFDTILLHTCGGSIISPSKILTAAHCLSHGKGAALDVSLLRVLTGCIVRLQCTNKTQYFEVLRYDIHPDFNTTKFQADIAILHLATNITIDDEKTAIISLSENRPSDGTKCTALGWGNAFKDGPLTNELLYVDLHVLNWKKCAIINNLLFIRQYKFHEFCAANKDDKSKDTCQGDSGGPLICNGELAGIVSHGFGCGMFSGHYTDVAYYRDWVLNANSKLTVNFKFIIFIFHLVLVNFPLFLWNISV